MSTIFQLLGSNSTIDDEVKRIVDLEDSFSGVYELLIFGTLLLHASSVLRHFFRRDVLIQIKMENKFIYVSTFSSNSILLSKPHAFSSLQFLPLVFVPHPIYFFL